MSASGPIFLPKVFKFSAIAVGLKASGKPDLALIITEPRTTGAALFTKNRVVAAPVEVGRASLTKSRGHVRAVIVNSGNANCATGPEGTRACRAVCLETARRLGVKPWEVLPSSTGIIGVPLPSVKITSRLTPLFTEAAASVEHLRQFANAILTTDTRPKLSSVPLQSGSGAVTGVAKGSGMIHPQLATMLVYLLTDIVATPAELQRGLKNACDESFNVISVDGDTSTNDTLLVLANGAAGAPAIANGSKAHRQFTAALEEVCGSLAQQIVADGEGAQRVIEIEVRGAKTESAAKKIAETIATSPLVKTAFAGGDPNWGRIFAAAGRSGIKFDPSLVEITMAGIKVLKRGQPLDFNERAASNKLLADHVPIVVHLHAGQSSAKYWTCDFTAEYVRINASYRT